MRFLPGAVISIISLFLVGAGVRPAPLPPAGHGLVLSFSGVSPRVVQAALMSQLRSGLTAEYAAIELSINAPQASAGLARGLVMGRLMGEAVSSCAARADNVAEMLVRAERAIEQGQIREVKHTLAMWRTTLRCESRLLSKDEVWRLEGLLFWLASNSSSGAGAWQPGSLSPRYRIDSRQQIFDALPAGVRALLEASGRMEGQWPGARVRFRDGFPWVRWRIDGREVQKREVKLSAGRHVVQWTVPSGEVLATDILEIPGPSVDVLPYPGADAPFSPPEHLLDLVRTAAQGGNIHPEVVEAVSGWMAVGGYPWTMVLTPGKGVQAPGLLLIRRDRQVLRTVVVQQ